MIDDKWRTEYRTRRYLEDLSDEELRQRGHDTFVNFMTINADGRLAPLPQAHEWHTFWRMRFVHFLEECVLRFGPYPAGLGKAFVSDLKIPNPRSPNVRGAASLVDRASLTYGEYLVKYGKYEFLKKTLDLGEVRVAPASSFADLRFNHAVRDTELEFSYLLYKPSHDDVRPFMNGKHAAPTDLEGSAVVTLTAHEDYYIYCLSASYDPRLFDDFEADACLLITDPVAFRDKLMWSVHTSLGARGHAFKAIDYVDPLTDKGEGIHFALRKNARYFYQDEVRAVWLPPKGVGPLSATVVSIGGLHDVATLYKLD